MPPPPKARAKRGNASRYCCGSGHAHRHGGSPAKAKVSTARHRSAWADVAVRMNRSEGLSCRCLCFIWPPVLRFTLCEGHLKNEYLAPVSSLFLKHPEARCEDYFSERAPQLCIEFAGSSQFRKSWAETPEQPDR